MSMESCCTRLVPTLIYPKASPLPPPPASPLPTHLDAPCVPPGIPVDGANAQRHGGGGDQIEADEEGMAGGMTAQPPC